jgi:hypothetical protein
MCINIALTWRNTAYRNPLDVDCDILIHSKFQFIHLFSYLWLADFPGSEYGVNLELTVGQSGEIAICEYYDRCCF